MEVRHGMPEIIIGQLKFLPYSYGQAHDQGHTSLVFQIPFMDLKTACQGLLGEYQFVNMCAEYCTVKLLSLTDAVEQFKAYVIGKELMMLLPDQEDPEVIFKVAAAEVIYEEEKWSRTVSPVVTIRFIKDMYEEKVENK